MSNEYLKSQPKDKSDKICANGSELNVFWVDSTGGWDAITLPEDIECKAVKIRVHDGAFTFAHKDNLIEFHYSNSVSGITWDWDTALVLSIGAKSGTILYVRAEAGQKIAVTALA